MNKNLKIASVCSPEAYQKLKLLLQKKHEGFPKSYLIPPEKYFYKNTSHREYLSRWMEAMICNVLNFAGHPTKKVETSGKKIKAKSGKEIWIKHRTSRKGEPDVMAIINGKATYFEVKIGKDTLSEDQKQDIEYLTNAGAAVYVVKTVDDFFKAVNM